MSVTAKDNAPTKPKDKSILEFLPLAGLKLCNFRQDVSLLKHLTILDLSNNEIEKLPPDLGGMPCLTELYLSNNQLGATEEVDWRWMLEPQIKRSLKLLDLSSNKLRNLPNAIWKLMNLVTLKVDNNQLTQIPASIGRISSLRYLTISRNKLEFLPCSLIKRQLEAIDLSYNNFSSSRGNTIHQDRYTMYQFCVGNLFQCAAKTVLKNKICYDIKIVPHSFVEFLDSANMCVCGNPVMNDVFSMIRPFDPKDFFKTVIADDTGIVKFECFFCSYMCRILFLKRIIIYTDNLINNVLNNSAIVLNQ